MNNYHLSVLLIEAVDALQVKQDRKYIDATLGGGGHSLEIIKRGGIVLGIDLDEDALGFVSEKLKSYINDARLKLSKGNFKDIDFLARENSFNKVSGVVFDLGVSGYQFDTEERGFSIQKDAPLDMRMDKNLSVTASDLVNGLTKGELYELFTKLGEEHYARAICDNISRAREINPIKTTKELAEIAIRSYPRGYKKIHPATKIFQALRIAVNDELNSLREALPKAIDLLESKGRLVVISFHSLEDRIVKRIFNQTEDLGKGKIITNKPVMARFEEIEFNKRARSAKLRVFEKI